MSEKIMFRGREVVEVCGGACEGCVGSVGDACFALPGCDLNHHFEYAVRQPPLDVFIDKAAKDYHYFGGKLHGIEFASGRYSTRRAAIRGAKRFCAKIGFECRIKGDK